MTQERPVALVTGGARRVGRAIVTHLSHLGFDVAFTYLSSGDAASELAQTLSRNGVKAKAIAADLTDPATAVPSIHDEFRRHWGRLDVLVNNASLFLPAPLEQTHLDLVRRLNAIHVESPLLLCQAFGPMLKSAHGCVINMVDLLAERPWPEYLAYCASKAGLLNLTLGLARALAPEVRVNGIAPGVVEWAVGMTDADKERYLKRVPLNRAGTPEDVAKLVGFLATDGAYLTGQILHLDGGRSIT